MHTENYRGRIGSAAIPTKRAQGRTSVNQENINNDVLFLAPKEIPYPSDEMLLGPIEERTKVSDIHIYMASEEDDEQDPVYQKAPERK